VNARAYHPQLLTAQRPAFAPALVAAYALGATLWAPTLVLVERLVAAPLGWALPGLGTVGNGEVFAAMWLLRFALYFIGAATGFDYGYGINGMIASRRLTLVEKVGRVARDWFGMVLLTVWLLFMTAVGIAVMLG
jgi:hypothetical protein